MRFKLVCKLWQSTILHDRRFHLSHRSLSPSRPSLLAFVGTYYPLSLYKPATHSSNIFRTIITQSNMATKYQELEKGPPSIENSFACTSISSSNSTSGHWKNTVWEDYHTTEVVNGLVCFYSKYNLYLCNLSTSETMKLPPALPDSNNVYYHPCPYHLGFDDLNKVYKLLQIQKHYFFIDKNNSKILTLEYNQNQNQHQDCWRNTTLEESIGFRRSYCFRSSLYWIMDFYLICFDLNKESYSTIKYPFNLDHDDTPVRAFRAPRFSMWNHHAGRYCDSLEAGLTQVGERLALTHSYVGATEFNIWFLDDNSEHLLYPKWDKITIHIPIHLRDPFPPSFPTGPLPAWTSEISWSSFITIPAGTLPGTKKIVFTIGRAILFKPLVGYHMPVYTYDLESETWETLDNNLPANVAASFSVHPAYKEYSQIYYFHEDNILPLKDILAPYDQNEA